MFVKAPKGISNADYARFMDVDIDVLRRLDAAHTEIEETLTVLEDTGVDSEAQRGYARIQIDSMRYLLDRILTEHLEA